MMQEARAAAQGRKKNRTGPAKGEGQPHTGPAFQSYNAAVQLLQQGKFDKALRSI